MNNEQYLRQIIKECKEDIEINNLKYKNRYKDTFKCFAGISLLALPFSLINSGFSLVIIFISLLISLMNIYQVSKVNETNEVLFAKIEYVNSELNKSKEKTISDNKIKNVNKNLYLIEIYKAYKEIIIAAYEKGNFNKCLDLLGINEENNEFIIACVTNDIKKLSLKK